MKWRGRCRGDVDVMALNFDGGFNQINIQPHLVQKKLRMDSKLIHPHS
jgi:hypothetical protein